MIVVDYPPVSSSIRSASTSPTQCSRRSTSASVTGIGSGRSITNCCTEPIGSASSMTDRAIRAPVSAPDGSRAGHRAWLARAPGAPFRLDFTGHVRPLHCRRPTTSRDDRRQCRVNVPHLPSRGHRTRTAFAPPCPVTLIGFLEIRMPSSATPIKLCIFNYLSQNPEIDMPHGKQTRLCYRTGTSRRTRTGLNTISPRCCRRTARHVRAPGQPRGAGDGDCRSDRSRVCTSRVGSCRGLPNDCRPAVQSGRSSGEKWDDALKTKSLQTKAPLVRDTLKCERRGLKDKTTMNDGRKNVDAELAALRQTTERPKNGLGQMPEMLATRQRTICSKGGLSNKTARAASARRALLFVKKTRAGESAGCAVKEDTRRPERNGRHFALRHLMSSPRTEQINLRLWAACDR